VLKASADLSIKITELTQAKSEVELKVIKVQSEAESLAQDLNRSRTDAENYKQHLNTMESQLLGTQSDLRESIAKAKIDKREQEDLLKRSKDQTTEKLELETKLSQLQQTIVELQQNERAATLKYEQLLDKGNNDQESKQQLELLRSNLSKQEQNHQQQILALNAELKTMRERFVSENESLTMIRNDLTGQLDQALRTKEELEAAHSREVKRIQEEAASNLNQVNAEYKSNLDSKLETQRTKLQSRIQQLEVG
jgi:chromosome segregation ATPase